jgi:hypothetical protein
MGDNLMRIRSTKPEFWRSKTIAEFEWEDRLVLKALEGYVDDNGVGKDNVVLFCADAFPHDLAKSSEICAKISGALSRFAEANLIVRYTVRSENLVYVRRWKQWQYIDKPKAGRYPRPDGTMNYREAVDESIGAGQGVCDGAQTPELREPSRKVRENFAQPPEDCPQIQSGEQGNRGTDKRRGYVSPGGHQSADLVPPPGRCPRHLNTPNPPSCGACADARRARKDFDADTQTAREQWAAEQREQARAHQREAAELRQRAIDACDLCDEDGYRNGIVCDHVDRTETARAGRAAVTAAIKGRTDG